MVYGHTTHPWGTLLRVSSVEVEAVHALVALAAAARAVGAHRH
jgi:hypothetical protein